MFNLLADLYAFLQISHIFNEKRVILVGRQATINQKTKNHHNHQLIVLGLIWYALSLSLSLSSSTLFIPWYFVQAAYWMIYEAPMSIYSLPTPSFSSAPLKFLLLSGHCAFPIAPHLRFFPFLLLLPCLENFFLNLDKHFFQHSILFWVKACFLYLILCLV